MAKKTKDKEADIFPSSSSSEDDDDYDDDEEDDPRLTAMFQGAVEKPKGGVAITNNVSLLDIQEDAIVVCFQRALETHPPPADADNNVMEGREMWKAPPLFKKMPEKGIVNDSSSSAAATAVDEDGVVAAWKPAALPLPEWVVQKPNFTKS